MFVKDTTSSFKNYDTKENANKFFPILRDINEIK